MLKKNGAGRPKKFKPEYTDQVYVACSEGGMTDKQLCKLFNIAESTINNWKHDHPEFYDNMIRGKDEFNCAKAEKALLKRVLGFRYTERTYEGIGKKMLLVKKVSKQIPPDTRALEYFLSNRNRERWQNPRQIIELDQAKPLKVTVEFVGMEDDES